MTATVATQRLTRLRDRLPEMVAAVGDLVQIESPSSDLVAVESALRGVSALAARVLGTGGRTVDTGGAPALLIGTDCPDVLLLGHADTVWPTGTLQRLPFLVDGDVLRGPGCFDMKAGIVQVMFALADRGSLDRCALLVTGDEEIGSPASRALIEERCEPARAVLVAEPSADGRLKVARKGIGMFRVAVTGRAAHAGLEPENGVNALVELSGLVRIVAGLGATKLGTTVTPTRSQSGTTVNTVPAEAWADVDVRATTAAELDRIDAAIRALVPSLPGASLRIEGGVNRPPFERAMAEPLLPLVAEAAMHLGLAPLECAEVGGGSDGNLTAARGVPTLDGLGPVGAGAHADDEHVLVPAMAERAALVAELIDLVLASPTARPPVA